MNDRQNNARPLSLGSVRKTRRMLRMRVWMCIGGFLVLGTQGCQNPRIVDQDFDFGTNPNGDGGGANASTRYNANPMLVASIGPEQGTPIYKQWKRDPHYVVDGGDQYLFFSGSGASVERWSIAYYKQTGAAPTQASPLSTNLAGRMGQGKWDGLDLTAPHLRLGSGAPKFTLYYAATSDNARPAYVSQIGAATSPDGVTWTRAETPALAVPAFENTTNNANLTAATDRKDAYGVTDPWVITDGSNTVMFYAGMDCPAGGTCSFSIFRSISPDGGTTFPPGTQVLKGRPGIAEEAGGVAAPSVVLSGGRYLMTYSALDTAPTRDAVSLRRALTRTSIGIASSSDGITWTPAAADTNIIVPKGASGYRASGASGASLYPRGTQFSFYFTGLIDNQTGVYFSLATADLAEVR